MSSPHLSVWKDKKDVRPGKDVKSFWQQMPTKLFGVESNTEKSQLLTFHPLKRKIKQASLLDALFASPKRKRSSRALSVDDIIKASAKQTPKRKRRSSHAASPSRPYSSTAVQKAKSSPAAPSASRTLGGPGATRPINRVVSAEKDGVAPIRMPAIRSLRASTGLLQRKKGERRGGAVEPRLDRRLLEEGEIDESIQLTPSGAIEPVSRPMWGKESPEAVRTSEAVGISGRKRGVSPRRKKRSISLERTVLSRTKGKSRVAVSTLGIGTAASPIIIIEPEESAASASVSVAGEEDAGKEKSSASAKEKQTEKDKAATEPMGPPASPKTSARLKKQMRALAQLSSYNNLPPGRTLVRTGRRVRTRTVKLEPGADASASHSRPAKKRGSKRKRLTSDNAEDEDGVFDMRVGKKAKIKVEPSLEKEEQGLSKDKSKKSKKTSKKKKKRSRTRESLEAELRSNLMDPLPNLNALVGLSSIATLLSIPKVSELADDGFAKEGFTVEQRVRLDNIT